MITFHTILARSRARPSSAPALSIGAPSLPLLILLSRGDCPLAHELVSRPRSAADRTLFSLAHPKEIAHAVVMEAAAAITITAALSLRTH